MERLSQSEIEFITQCLKATRKLHNRLDCAVGVHLAHFQSTVATTYSIPRRLHHISAAFRFASRDNFRAAADWGLPHHGNRRASPLQLSEDHDHDDNSAAAW